jgi:glycosyltransferase involved in cell wall biosynthesis
MNVVIALTSLARRISGVQRHAVNLARCLLTRREVTAVHLIAAPWQQDLLREAVPSSDLRDPRLHLHASPVGSSALSRNLWYYRKLPKLAEQLEADIVHLAYPVPLRAEAFPCPAVVTLHDLYPYDIPENFGFPRVLFNQFILRQCLTAVDAVTCVSASTLSRLEHIEPGVALCKSVVVPNCVEPYPLASPLSALPDWHGEPFLLCVAQHRRNKNILFLLRVFQRLLRTQQIAANTRLVLVGIPGPETKKIRRFLFTAKIEDRIVLLNGISEEQLQWCYRHCDLLAVPSLVEGFGLPVAEALLAGCRVVCSDIPAFREIGGDHCDFIPLDASAEQAFAAAIHNALHQPRHKPINLPQFSAPILAEAYLRLYHSLLRPAPVPTACRLQSSLQASERTPLL